MMKAGRSHQVRIIGGSWRGRKLVVGDLDGLRPTPDRVRETLFNWVSSLCRGATVLDCFAGSGALGFEAASRGAAEVILVEKQASIAKLLKKQAEEFNADSITIQSGSIEQYLQSCEQVFDLVFIDPPYAHPELRQSALNLLLDRQLLADEAMVYLEWPHNESFELSSSQLSWYRHKRAGQIEYAVAQHSLSR